LLPKISAIILVAVSRKEAPRVSVTSRKDNSDLMVVIFSVALGNCFSIEGKKYDSWCSFQWSNMRLGCVPIGSLI
jgi:hypothetical protein